MRLTPPTWTRRWPSALVVNLATLGPVGRRLPAPGTWGSLVGVGYFWFGFAGLSATWTVLLSALAAYLAVAICGEAEIRLRRQDPGDVVLDECVAIPWCFLGWPALTAVVPVWVALLAGFALFRFFDIAKPWGIARLQRLPGGWGVVVDDLAAALATCTTLHLGVWLWTIIGR